MGFSKIDSQGLTAPPFFISFLVTIFSTWIADKTQQRAYTIIILTTVGGIGYILLVSVESVGVRYFGVFLAASGIFPSARFIQLPDDWQWSDTVTSRYSKHTTVGNEYVLGALEGIRSLANPFRQPR